MTSKTQFFGIILKFHVTKLEKSFLKFWTVSVLFLSSTRNPKNMSSCYFFSPREQCATEIFLLFSHGKFSRTSELYASKLGNFWLFQKLENLTEKCLSESIKDQRCSALFQMKLALCYIQNSEEVIHDTKMNIFFSELHFEYEKNVIFRKVTVSLPNPFLLLFGAMSSSICCRATFDLSAVDNG